MHREPEVPEAEAQVEEGLDCRAGKTSKELAPLHSVINDILQKACSTSPRMDADVAKSALMRLTRLMSSLAKGLKEWWQKCSGNVENYTTIWVAYLKIWSRRSLHRSCGRAQTYCSQSDVFDSLKRWYVMLTFETKINHLEWFAQVILINITPMLQNLRIGLRKRRNGKSKVPAKQRGSWPKILLKLKEHQRAAFFSPSENRCLLAEEREFVVDSCESIHMISKKDLNDAEMENLTTSKCAATVITANGEVQTYEEATVYVKELDFSWQWKFSRIRQQFYR